MDKRRFLIWLGNILARTQAGNAVSLLVGVLGLVFGLIPDGDVGKYFHLDSAQKIFLYVIIVLIATVGMALSIRFFGELLIRKGENTPHEVEVLPIPDSERKFERIDGETIVRSFSYLKIINNENTRITNCYAVIRKATPITSDKDLTGLILGNEPKRLSWSDNQGNSNFEISIGARTGVAHLYVYEIAVNLFKDSPVVSDFCTKGKQVARFVLGSPNRVVYKIEFEFFGNVGSEELKIEPFVGCVDVAFYQSKGETSFPMTIYEGSPRND